MARGRLFGKIIPTTKQEWQYVKQLHDGWSGSFRIVFPLGDEYAVKFAFDEEWGADSNLNEWKQWQERAPTDEVMLTPVLAKGRGGRWLIMPRADETLMEWQTRHGCGGWDCHYYGRENGFYCDKHAPEEAVYVIQWAKDRGITDIHDENVARFGDTWQVIDYGGG